MMSKAVHPITEAFLSKASLVNKSGIEGVSLFHPSNYTFDLKKIDALPFTTKKLGHRAEELFEQFILHHPDYELLDCNIQIIKDGRTIGEIDYLIKEVSTNAIYHIELAFKIYLYDKKSGDGSKAWIGPNRKDSLHHKLYKLQFQQFPLLYHEATEPYLSSLGLKGTDIEQRLFIPGMTFLPMNHRLQENSNVNAECVAGHYINASGLELAFPDTTQGFIPAKINWMLEPAESSQWHSRSYLLPIICNEMKSKRSTLLWLKHANGTFERLMVVWW